MIDANVTAFSNLTDQLVEFDDYLIESGRRFIFTNPNEKDWLKYTTIKDTVNILTNSSATIISYGSEIYICITGLSIRSEDFEDTILVEQNLNAGLITLLISDGFLKLSSSVNHLAFYDNILFQHKDRDYQGHDFNEILEYLQPIQIFQIPNRSFFGSEDILRILSYIFSKNSKLLNLVFDEDTLQTFSEIALTSSKHISFNLILNCLLSNSFKHAFLELYRLIERVFSVGYLKDLYEKMETKLTFFEFSATVEQVTNWRPKEDLALEKIFTSTSEKTKTFFQDFLQSSDFLKNQIDYACFYKLRNSIVHFRPSHKENDLNVKQWNLLLTATLYIVDEQYSLYQNILE